MVVSEVVVSEVVGRCSFDRLHAAEQALVSDDPAVRENAIATAGDIIRAAHQAVAEDSR